MFVRKGTTLRKKHQSIKRQRRQSLPVQHVASDAELGESSTASERGRFSTTSSASTLTLNEEKQLVEGDGRYLRHQNYQPVSYGSVLLQLREARLESADLCDFLQRMHEIVWQSIVTTVVLLLLFSLPISMVAMGTSYLEECPKEPKIPVYLLVGGCFGFIHICILLWQQKRYRAYMLLEDTREDADSDENDVVTRSYRFTLYILSLFLIGWFALGNYWFFSIWQPNFSQPLHEPRNWCAYQLYTYSFYQILACYSIVGLMCVLFIGCLLVYACGITGS